jgi:hypothetical protein
LDSEECEKEIEDILKLGEQEDTTGEEVRVGSEK